MDAASNGQLLGFCLGEEFAVEDGRPWNSRPALSGPVGTTYRDERRPPVLGPAADFNSRCADVWLRLGEG